MKQTFICIFLSFLCVMTEAQIVVDAQTKEPIPMAYILGKTKQTITNLRGHIQYPTVFSKGDSLHISCIGYETKSILYHPDLDSILLKEKEILLNEVVVKGKKCSIKNILKTANKQIDANYRLEKGSKNDYYLKSTGNFLSITRSNLKSIIVEQVQRFEWLDDEKYSLQNINSEIIKERDSVYFANWSLREKAGYGWSPRHNPIIHHKKNYLSRRNSYEFSIQREYEEKGLEYLEIAFKCKRPHPNNTSDKIFPDRIKGAFYQGIITICLDDYAIVREQSWGWDFAHLSIYQDIRFIKDEKIGKYLLFENFYAYPDKKIESYLRKLPSAYEVDQNFWEKNSKQALSLTGEYKKQLFSLTRAHIQANSIKKSFSLEKLYDHKNAHFLGEEQNEEAYLLEEENWDAVYFGIISDKKGRYYFAELGFKKDAEKLKILGYISGDKKKANVFADNFGSDMRVVMEEKSCTFYQGQKAVKTDLILLEQHYELE